MSNMFQSLSEKLAGAFSKFKNKGKLTEKDIKEGMREIKLALLEADVNFKVVREFIKKVTERAVGADVLESLLPAQQIVKIVNEELTALMGGENEKIHLNSRPPTVIMMVGLQGAGKTTHCGKLAGAFRKQGRRPLLVACDVYRPAAIKQLQVIGEQLDIPVYSEGTDVSPVEIAKAGIEHAKKHGHDIVFIDTAGRLQIDEQMMQEIESIKKAIKPSETLFVVDAMTGQDAVNTAKTFNERLDFDGVVLTKLDGDTRGGAALSIRTVVDKPIKFVGTGETLDGIDVFHPSRMADRILGMGDIVSLVEKAQQQFDEKEAEEIARKLRKNQYTFVDFYKQIQQIKKMGNVKDLAAMIPGLGKALKDIDVPDDAFKGVEAIINSMTPYEREHPEAIKGTRVKRIALGSGTTIQEVNRLLKQFEQTRQMMRQVGSMKSPMAAMRGLKGMKGMRR